MAATSRTIRTVALVDDRLVLPLSLWGRPTFRAAGAALARRRRPCSLFAAAPLRAPPPGSCFTTRPRPFGALLFSSTSAGRAQRPVEDADGTRDEAIRAPLVEVYDENGTLRGRASPKAVLSRINRDTHMLVVNKRFSSAQGRGGAGPLPAVQVVSKDKYRADQQERQRWKKEERFLEPKEKTLTVNASCNIADLGHKAKGMRALLEKGDHVRVVIEPPRRKTFGGKQPSPQQVEELTARIWEYFREEWDAIAKMGRIGAGKKGGQEALFIPHLSKRDIHQQNEKNKQNEQNEQNENEQNEQNKER